MKAKSEPRKAETGLRRFLRDNGLSLVMFGLFLLTFIGQSVAGLHNHNQEQQEHGQPAATYGAYLRSGDFLESVFENWESEFLQMASHAVTGLKQFNEEEQQHGQPTVTFGQYVTGSRFWFESFQNWQSEFLSVGVLVVLSIFLRQRGSPESKPVHQPHRETEGA